MVVMQHGDPTAGGGLAVIHIKKEQYDANPSAYDDPNVLLHIKDDTPGLISANSVKYGTTNVGFVGDIATKAIAEKIEFSDTAIYPHSVGEGFINKDGEYCVCTSAVSVGQTLTKNTNYVVTTIGAQLAVHSEIISLALTNHGNGNLYVDKTGNIGVLSIGGTAVSGLTPESMNIVATLPIGYRPTRTYSIYTINHIGNPFQITIYTNGEVGIYPYQQDQSAYFAFSFPYMVA